MLGVLWRTLTESRVSVDFKGKDLSGQNIIVTGCNTGIGFSTAKIFADMNSNVYMACRTKSKAEDAMKEILKENENAKLKFLELDLSNLSSIDNLISKIDFPVDVLVNNAGVVCKPETKNTAGWEIMFAVNTIGTYYLSKKMIPLMNKNGRIVMVSAGSHHMVKKKHIKKNKLEDYFVPPVPSPWFYSGRLSSFYHYSVTKTFMIMLAYKLHEEYFEKTGVSINSLHPGVIKTEFGKPRDEKQKKVMRKKLMENSYSVALNWVEGAQTTVFVSLSKKLEKVSGKYFDNCKEMETSDLTNDKGYQDLIYSKVEEILKKHEEKKEEEEEEGEEEEEEEDDF